MKIERCSAFLLEADAAVAHHVPLYIMYNVQCTTTSHIQWINDGKRINYLARSARSIEEKHEARWLASQQHNHMVLIYSQRVSIFERIRKKRMVVTYPKAQKCFSLWHEQA